MVLLIDEENILHFSGNLDENISNIELTEQLKSNLSLLKIREMAQFFEVSFEKIDRVNSIGLKTLVSTLSQIKEPLIFRKSPVWLVDQFNLIKGFFGNKNLPLDFYCPFYCQELAKEEIILISLKNFDREESFLDQNIPPLEIDGHIYNPDFNIDYFLGFLEPIEERIKYFISHGEVQP